jgi:hypothetical protein
MELLELKETLTAAQAEHIQECARCPALLEALPDLDSTTLAPASEDLPSGSPRATAASVEVKPGTIWTADDGEGLGFRELLAVLGRSQRDPRLVVVVPISEEVEDGTDLDLPISQETLGYPAQLAVWNHGWIYDDQLHSPLGSLDQATNDEMGALYRWLVAGGEKPAVRALVGPALLGPDDARHLRRDEERERLQMLWRRVSEEQEPEDGRDETRLVATSPPSFGSLIATALQSEDWDEVTLAEAATVETGQIANVVADDLDLTWATDVRVVVSLAKALGFALEELEAPIRASLIRSQGGAPVPGEHFRAAARAASDEQVERDLHTKGVDESAEARTRQIALYWQRVVEWYDELS